jgi:hypothetical protein
MIFAIYICLSFVIEFIVFYAFIKPKLRKTLFEGSTRKFTYFTMTTYIILGLIAKGDIYTDIAFIVEMQKCNSQKGGVYGPAILIIAAIVFFMTIAYQLY